MSRDRRYDIDVNNVVAFAEENRPDVYRMIIGHDPYDLAEMVRAVGGKREAARITGRSVRTVERWITTTGTQRISRPRADAATALRTASEQARDSAQGRRRILEGDREAKLRNLGVKMRGWTYAGPLVGGNYYRRKRQFDHGVPGSILSKALDAYLAAGEAAAFLAFNKAFGEKYELTGHAPDEVEFLIEDWSALEFPLYR